MSASSRAFFRLCEEEDAREALESFEQNLTKTKGKENEHRNIDSWGKRIWQVSKPATHEASGNAADSINSKTAAIQKQRLDALQS